MLFKEKLLLSNCDSVRGLDGAELRKRFLTALAFADGVVISPNALLDNLHMSNVIAQRNVVRYLNEEGHGKLVIRGFGLEQAPSLIDYYDALPDSFILSSLPGAPRKDNLTRAQHQLMHERVTALQQVIDRINPVIENVSLPRESLRNEIRARLATPGADEHFFANDELRQQFQAASDQAISRSDWYFAAQDFFAANRIDASPSFRAEVIDPAYNSLFATSGEGFLQDDIRYLSGVPESLLDASVSIKSMRREITLIRYPLKVFEFISSLGAGEIARYLTDEAINYMEDRLVESGHSYMTRKNWFGMYPRMRRFMGLEIK